ncbi:MAG: glyoxalase [Sphingomonas sp. 28-66-16]|nr:MAG: glyoxalase [Sphingomonas sp. 28-66-16]
MFSHVVLGANDLDAAKTFYDAVIGSLGGKPGMINGERIVYMNNGGLLLVGKPINGEEACHANGGTIGFAAASPEQVDAFHAAGVANGGTTCENPPGLRDGGFGKLYLAYLRDPDGNKICAMHRVG